MSNPSRRTVALVKQRDGLRCVRCGRFLEGVPASIHHRRMRSHKFTGLHEPSNLICLCGTGSTGCHGWVHAHPKEAYEQGWLVHGWNDPTYIPVFIHSNRFIFLDDAGHYLNKVEIAA